MKKFNFMKKFQTFAYILKNSAFKPGYYFEVLKAPFRFSFKYFLFLFLLLSFLTVITLVMVLIQKVNPFLDQAKTQVPQVFPQELVIEIKDGQATTNVMEPYFVALNPDWFGEEIEEGLKRQPIQNILVIDTSAQATDIRKYQTFALLTKNDIVFFGDDQEVRAQSLAEVEDFVLDKKVVENLWNKVTPYFKYIVPSFILLTALFLPGFTVLTKFIYLVFFSVFTLIVARVFKNKKVNYSKALQINLHAITLPTLIIALFELFGARPQIPFFHSIILLIFNLIIFASLREKKKNG